MYLVYIINAFFNFESAFELQAKIVLPTVIQIQSLQMSSTSTVKLSHCQNNYNPGWRIGSDASASVSTNTAISPVFSDSNLVSRGEVLQLVVFKEWLA